MLWISLWQIFREFPYEYGSDNRFIFAKVMIKTQVSCFFWNTVYIIQAKNAKFYFEPLHENYTKCLLWVTVSDGLTTIRYVTVWLWQVIFWPWTSKLCADSLSVCVVVELVGTWIVSSPLCLSCVARRSQPGSVNSLLICSQRSALTGAVQRRRTPSRDLCRLSAMHIEKWHVGWTAVLSVPADACWHVLTRFASV